MTTLDLTTVPTVSLQNMEKALIKYAVSENDLQLLKEITIELNSRN